MRTSFLSKLSIIACITIILASCKEQKPQFTIEGKVSDADTLMLYLERRSLNETAAIDSVKLNKDGDFKFKEASLGYAEFYLLRLNGQTINLSVDSTETIKVNASKPTFAIDYTVEGSEGSAKIKEIVLAQHKLSNSFIDQKKRYDSKEITQDQYVSSVKEAIEEYKSKAKEFIYSDYKSLASYFALFQKVDDYLIFDPYDKKDLSAFQAVATVWDQYKSKSPRAEHLKNFTLSALAEVRKMANQEATIKKLVNSDNTNYSEFYDISLPDINNTTVKLSSLRGKVTILDFTAYKTNFSPAHNILLNRLYTKYKDKIEIYQVSLDADVHAWQNSATNLPWVCVRDAKSVNSDLLLKFNVQGLPTTFLINQKGEVVRRISSTDDISSEVQKLL